MSVNIKQKTDPKSLLAFELLLSSLFINILGLTVPLFVIQVLNRYIAHGIDGTLISLAMGAFIAVALEFSFREVRIRLAGCASDAINRRLSTKTFVVLLNMRGQALTNVPQKLRTEIMQGIESVQQATAAPNITALLDVPFAVFYLFALWILSPALFIIAVFFIMIALLLSWLGIRSTKVASTTLAKEMTSRRALINVATLSGVDTIRAFDAQNYVMRMWKTVSEKIDNINHFMQTRQGLMQTSTQAISGIMTICIISVGAKLSTTGDLNIGIMMGGNILAARALMPISRLATYGQSISKARAAMRQLEQFHKMPIELQKGTEIKNFTGDLELVDLSYNYINNPSPLFESLSIKLPHGSIVAVVGHNGAGKTTLARLLMGLIDPSRGKIMADGVDLRQIGVHWWRHHVSYLPQEPSFIEGTLRDNICIGTENVSEDTLQSIINDCGLKHYVDNSGNGLDEIIYNNGKDMAVGIRRRIAMARALVTDGKILILDEPTEGLDREGQQAIYTVIGNKLKKGYTVIVFSHDQGLLQHAHYLIDLNSKPTPKIGLNKQFVDAVKNKQNLNKPDQGSEGQS